MTEQERLKTDTVFVDTVIRECALMTIQKEADAQRIAELEDRLDAVSAIPPAEPSAALQRQLDKAVADLHFVMAGGGPGPPRLVPPPGRHTSAVVLHGTSPVHSRRPPSTRHRLDTVP